MGIHLAESLRRLVEDGSLSVYIDPFKGGARAAFAELVGDHLGLHLDADDIRFVRGGTEAINLITAHLASTGHGLTLPLPNYYAFDHCAARWQAPVTGYYRHDGTLHLTGHADTPHTALVDVLPNGVTGTIYTTPEGPDYDFVLLDAVIQVGHFGTGPSPTSALRAKARALDLEHSAIIMTASKDLALPGIRAAAVISRNAELRAHIGRDAFDRAPVTSPLGSLLMTLYAALLTALEAPEDHLDKVHAAAEDTAARHGLPPLPPVSAVRRLLDHMAQMTEHYQANFHRLAQDADILSLPAALAPTCGYSAFPELAVPRADFLGWVRQCALDGLRLNPTVVHGGTTDAWKHLMPGQHLRINLSESRQDMARGLQEIRMHLNRSNRQAP
ncbi:aminotransferase class I/II-fold pyridoxal phosphate-dependent enzyme [Streptomyces sp. CA-181903]|uniref:aminotransferase class I/II-fold pyridoxal phosphate-dependent enzyme n=1 Tax=Streptomyces sp. CA-181903 TaxID=3240055 RepID=UPI003D918FA2